MKMHWLLLVTLGCVAGGTLCAEDWPQWRGPRRDNLSKESGLLKQWPKEGPKLRWVYKQTGIGFSGVAVVGDVLYTMGARGPEGKEQEYVIALDLKTPGKVAELWATPIGKIFEFPENKAANNMWGEGPRATPTVDGDFVYCLGGLGELVCLARDKGTVVWRKNLISDFAGEIMAYSPELTGPTGWGYCESPLVDGTQLICCPGGPKGWMLALNKKDGTVLWRSKELGQATDSSVVIATVDGVRQYVNSYFKGSSGGGGVAGIHAATGEVLWSWDNTKYNVYAICPTPVIKDHLVYVTAGYGAGCNLLAVTKAGEGKFAVKDQYAFKAKNLMKSETGGVVLVDGFIYGHSEKLGWVCQEFKTGKEMWTDRSNPDRLGGSSGSLTYADGHLYLLSDEGEACLIEANSDPSKGTGGWIEKGRFKLPELSEIRPAGQHPRRASRDIRVWTHPVLANGRLYLRDQELLYCYEVR